MVEETATIAEIRSLAGRIPGKRALGGVGRVEKTAKIAEIRDIAGRIPGKRSLGGEAVVEKTARIAGTRDPAEKTPENRNEPEKCCTIGGHFSGSLCFYLAF